MNTLSILDANTSNLPEGLYLQLVNALKLDFETPCKFTHMEKKKAAFYGYFEAYDELEQEDSEDMLKYLKEHFDDKKIIKELFDAVYDFRGYTYNIETDLVDGYDTDGDNFEIIIEARRQLGIEMYSKGIEYIDSYFYWADRRVSFWIHVEHIYAHIQLYYSDDIFNHLMHKFLWEYL